MNASHGRDAVASTVPSAVIRLPVESILLPVLRTVSDGAGDGAIAALIAVMGTNEAKAFGAKGITGSRLQSTRKIAAEYAKARRNWFDSLDAAVIAERGGKKGMMLSVVTPYARYVESYVKMSGSFSYLITNLKTVTAYGMENRPICEIPTDSIWDTTMGCRAICVSCCHACRPDRTGSGSRRSPSPAISSALFFPRAGSSASSCASASMRRIAAAHM